MEEEIILKEDQQKAYDMLVEGHNVFITGSAGTGKSKVIEKYIGYMKSLHKKVVVTAPTGVAAININGVTFHSAFGYPIKPIVKDDKEYKDIRVKYKSTWDIADVIIIDEVSMLRVDVFDMFCLQLKDIEKRQNRKIQIILVGDFFQLPPVINKFVREALLKQYPDIDKTKGFIFTSEHWMELGLHGCRLEEVIRQEDKEFVKHLELIKIGSKEGIEWVNNNAKINEMYDDTSIILCSKNEEADAINREKLKQINSENITMEGELHYNYSGYDIDCNKDLANSLYVDLKVGARVLCLVNDKNQHYQNGSLGTVEFIDEKYKTVTVRFDNGYKEVIEEHVWIVKKYGYNEEGKYEELEVAEFKQIPLKLGYAITIHKSQGQTYDKVIIQTEKLFSVSQIYVALGRCKSIKGITLTSPIKYNPKMSEMSVVRKFYGV